MAEPIALISGVGPGTGAALARRFAAGGHRVAMLARDGERLAALEREIAGARGIACDVGDAAQVDDAVARVDRELGAPSVLIHNAVGGAFANFLDLDPAVLEHNFRVNVMGFLHLARRLAPAMIAAGAGAIVATGNTSALRGKADFAGFAPTKAAQRILAESMARHLGPQGVHVAYVVIDAVIDLPWTRQMMHARLGHEPADDFFIPPQAIADEIWHVVQQPRSAWSFNVELRPYREAW
ncbi:MAG TPA: SDR family NAD(P)-dependent oxidoreductase [Candidatus Dormibacteraeota bacterium]|nr:SDR family NAD(P)-dependent oxidoreductase [Candidatus Dormibacteraeota bacterium]